jgi:hypothetical protein
MSSALRRYLLISMLFTSLASSSTWAAASFAAGPPSQMQHVVVRYTEPKPEPNSFAAQPKEFMRAGEQFGRIAEAPDPAMHMHQLLIINAPDCWICNLYAKNAKHLITTKDETVRLPIFPGRGPAANKLLKLEFGKEFEFFKQQHVAKTSAKDTKGQAIDQYTFPVSASLTVVFTVDPKTNKPQTISMKNKTAAMTLEYVTYEMLPYQASLFKPPAGMPIEDMKVKPMTAATTPTSGGSAKPGQANSPPRSAKSAPSTAAKSVQSIQAKSAH